MPIRVGVNALYLIPGGVGGTEIYLRNLLAALAQIDPINAYSVLTNRETADLTPAAPNFRQIPTPVLARIRPYLLLWEQIPLPSTPGTLIFFSTPPYPRRSTPPARRSRCFTIASTNPIRNPYAGSTSPS